MKVNYPRSGSQSGPGPTRNRDQHGTGPIQRMLGTTPWPGPGLEQLCLAPVPALKSGSGSAVSGSPSPQKPPPRATGSRDPPESSSHAQDAGERAPVRPEGADRSQEGAPAVAQPGPRLQSGPPAARARAHSPPRRRRRRRPGTRKVGAAAAPPRLRLRPAARAALPSRSRPRPRPPRALTPRVGAARRARLGHRREASPRATGTADLGAAFRQPGLPRDARKRLRARRPRAAIPGRRGWGAGMGVALRDQFRPLWEARCGLPLG